MSKKSSSVIITITVTLTVFVAVLVFLLNPKRGDDNLSAAVFNESQSRQNSSIVTVSEPLETDLVVRSEEEKVASDVASILLSDSAFISSVGEKTEVYAESAFDEKAGEYDKTIDEKLSSNDGRIDELERKYEETAATLLENEVFVNAIVEVVREKAGDDVDAEELAVRIINTEAFKEALKDYIKSSEGGTVPVPVFKNVTSEIISEEEYRDSRSEERKSEMEKVFDYLGY